jgi:hypothetical protein
MTRRHPLKPSKPCLQCDATRLGIIDSTWFEMVCDAKPDGGKELLEAYAHETVDVS